MKKDTNKHTKRLTLTITKIIIYEIWQFRNQIKYDKIMLNTKTIIKKINKYIVTILDACYKKHKIENTLIEFNDLFCIHNATATLQNKKLKLLTTLSSH